MSVTCPVCRREAAEDPSKPCLGDHAWIECERCGGTFEIGGSYYSTRRHTSEPLPVVSAMLRHAFERQEPRRILTDGEAQRLEEQAPSSTDAKARQLLGIIARKARHSPGKSVVLTNAIDYPLAYADDERGLLSYLVHLESKGWIEVKHGDSASTRTLTVSGVMEVEQM